MKLYKTVPRKKEDSDELIDEKIEMHPLETNEISALWAIHDVRIKIPSKPSKEEEYEWLIEYGAEYVKQKRAEWQKAYDAVKPELDAAEQYHQKCSKEWHDHVEKAVSVNADPDTHEIEKYKNG